MSTEISLPAPYLTGFVEGQGSFTYSRSGRHLALYFSIRLPAAERALLEAIRAFFDGAGKIYLQPRAAGHASAYYRVCKSADLLRVLDHFDRHPLRGAKRHAYEVWREMVLMRAAYHGRQPPEQLHRLAERLSRVSAGEKNA